jgi:hypothetical protein
MSSSVRSGPFSGLVLGCRGEAEGGLQAPGGGGAEVECAVVEVGLLVD